jgi:hypothetical protein
MIAQIYFAGQELLEAAMTEDGLHPSMNTLPLTVVHVHNE